MKSFIERYRTALIVGVLALCAAAVFVTTTKAKAADSWTGIGVGVHGSLADAAIAPSGSPINVGSTGELVGGSVFGKLQMQSMVVGAFVDYDRALGDLNTVGLNDVWTVGGLIGFLPATNVLPYIHGGWSRFNVDSIGHIDGWNLGVGTEVKLARNVSFDMRYTHTWLDVKDLVGPGVDARGDTFRIGLNIALYSDGKRTLFDDDAPAPAAKACDPKMANCKR